MKTLHVDTGRLWRGGQRQCCLLCGHLTAAGHEALLVCRRGTPLWQRAETAGVALHPLGGVLGMDLLAGVRLADLVRRAAPEVLAAHDAHALGLLALASRWAGSRAPLVYHRRVDLPVAGHLLSRWKMARVERFICVSQRIAAILAACGMDPRRIRVVHSGTAGIAPEQDAGAGLRGEFGVPGGGQLLAAVGGLIPHKGHRVLIEALAHLAPTRGSLHLLLVGDGPLRGDLEARAERLGLAERVHFLGERQDLGAIYGALDLLVHPSLTEGLGTAILDAFSAGVPVVASRTGGIPEMVQEGKTGWLVEPGDVAALAAAIAQSLDDAAERDRRAAAGRDLHRQQFTAAAMGEKTLGCYRELVG
jgi:glycosyltransferase involved in cell wall biosynthesis